MLLPEHVLPGDPPPRGCLHRVEAVSLNGCMHADSSAEKQHEGTVRPLADAAASRRSTGAASRPSPGSVLAAPTAPQAARAGDATRTHEEARHSPGGSAAPAMSTPTLTRRPSVNLRTLKKTTGAVGAANRAIFVAQGPRSNAPSAPQPPATANTREAQATPASGSVAAGAAGASAGAARAGKRPRELQDVAAGLRRSASPQGFTLTTRERADQDSSVEATAAHQPSAGMPGDRALEAPGEIARKPSATRPHTSAGVTAGAASPRAAKSSVHPGRVTEARTARPDESWSDEGTGRKGATAPLDTVPDGMTPGAPAPALPAERGAAERAAAEGGAVASALDAPAATAFPAAGDARHGGQAPVPHSSATAAAAAATPELSGVAAAVPSEVPAPSAAAKTHAAASSGQGDAVALQQGREARGSSPATPRARSDAADETPSVHASPKAAPVGLQQPRRGLAGSVMRRLKLNDRSISPASAPAAAAGAPEAPACDEVDKGAGTAGARVRPPVAVGGAGAAAVEEEDADVVVVGHHAPLGSLAHRGRAMRSGADRDPGALQATSRGTAGSSHGALDTTGDRGKRPRVRGSEEGAPPRKVAAVADAATAGEVSGRQRASVRRSTASREASPRPDGAARSGRSSGRHTAGSAEQELDVRGLDTMALIRTEERQGRARSLKRWRSNHGVGSQLMARRTAAVLRGVQSTNQVRVRTVAGVCPG